jgi:hypothetical protein
MSWRRLHLVLFLIVVVVAVIRIATGNLLGAIVPLIMAVIFGSIAMDYPLVTRLRKIWRAVRRLWR